jgi:hypothetical protein
MPVFAMDSMMTQGMVSKAPTAVTARIDHQGVCVGDAVTAIMDMTKPKAKTMPYCQTSTLVTLQFQAKSERGGWVPYPPLWDFLVTSHHS